MSIPPDAFLADVYRHLPFLVVHTTTDGTVLHCNPETLRITGYEEAELLGKNFWAILFPGKLFAQVPKFISLLQPSPLLKDVPMTLRTKAGHERIIAFSRYMHDGAKPDVSDSAARSFICIGVDLTDRLLDADRAQLPALPNELSTSDVGVEGGVSAFGPHVGNAGAIDGEVITPIAITPKMPLGNAPPGQCSLEQIREGLARVDMHMSCVQSVFADAEFHTLAALSSALRAEPRDTRMCEYVAREDNLDLRTHTAPLGAIRARVDELLSLYRPSL